MYLGGIISALLTGQMVQADTITAEPAKLVLQNQTENAGQFTVDLEGGQAKSVFVFLKAVFSNLSRQESGPWKTIQIWLKFLPSIDESGQFVAVFSGWDVHWQ